MTKPESILGKQPRSYAFILNPYADIRLSRCPKCNKLTHPRKFALFVHIDGWGPMILGKTCRYCTPCELIIAHQDELEAELTRSFAAIAPEAIGNKYLVVGTVDKRVWRAGLTGHQTLEKILQHMADFKQVLNLEVEGGWKRT
jgi:hypothetical protein